MIGTGYHDRMVVPEETREAIRARGIELIAQPSREAVETFNSLSEDKDKRVVAAFHLSC